MSKDLNFSFLLDFYGNMLTQKQREAIELYYDEDLSLAEIALNQGITRQGVRDSIKRAEYLLFDMEKQLGLAKRFQNMRSGFETIIQQADIIDSVNKRIGLSNEIYKSTNIIRKTINELSKV